MAGKGGGAWKVAYADFVTAMMAFFLVMWIVSQDKKVKEAVAHYFMDPMGYFPMGSSKNPAKGGALFQSVEEGRVPDGQNVPRGRGRDTYTDDGEKGYATQMVGEWIRGDSKLNEHWLEQAEDCRTLAERSLEAGAWRDAIENAAKALLRKRLRDEILLNIPGQVKGIYQDMLFAAMNEVQWDQLAEDIMNE